MNTDFASVAGVCPVLVVTNWRELTRKEFLSRAEAPMITDDGRFTPATVRTYLDAPPAGFPPVAFHAADVGPGDAIYVPWRWVHQVENLGESIAVSHFYVSRENYNAAVAFFRTTRGLAPALLLRTVMGTGLARSFFRRPAVRQWLRNGRSSAPLRRLMSLAIGHSVRRCNPESLPTICEEDAGLVR